MSTNSTQVVLVTTKQPSSNPRLVKEAISLYHAGYQVTVIYNFWSLWADRTDAAIIRANPGIQWQCVKGHPVNSKWYYWYSRLRHKLYKLLAAKFPRNLFFNERAEAQFYQELEAAASAVKAGLYIAHNLGALSPAVAAAKKNSSQYAFDAEDYHRNMAADSAEQLVNAALLEDRYLPGAAYVTTASPLITAAYTRNYPDIDFREIHNYFSKWQQPVFKQLAAQPLKLFWFSQTTGLKRGLQDAVMAMNEITGFEVECTIVGDAAAPVINALTGLLTNPIHRLFFEPPCSENQLIEMASNHHIGLALEPGFSVNNNIALSNKLFTYLLAGNAVILSATDAQADFYKAYPGVGWLYKPGAIDAFTGILKTCYSQLEELESKRKYAWQLAAQQLNWENESLIFTGLVQSVLTTKQTIHS